MKVLAVTVPTLSVRSDIVAVDVDQVFLALVKVEPWTDTVPVTLSSATPCSLSPLAGVQHLHGREREVAAADHVDAVAVPGNAGLRVRARGAGPVVLMVRPPSDTLLALVSETPSPVVL